MSEEVKHFEETFESTDLVHTMRKSFLEYSMRCYCIACPTRCTRWIKTNYTVVFYMEW